MLFETGRLEIIVGHFGSGKTEFSVNLALRMADEGRKVTLADLDIVNPYFRSRERAELFEQRGIRLIASSQRHMDADLPALPPDVMALFDDEGSAGVIDIGGDPSGARVLARFKGRIDACAARGADGSSVRVLCVVNANRPLTDTPERAVDCLRMIEATSKQRIHGLVNNTHLCGQTSIEDIIAGAELARAVSELTDIPVVCHAVPEHLAEEAARLFDNVFPMKIYMKKPWE